MTPDFRPGLPIDLAGWDRLPQQHEPLAGQKNLFDPMSFMMQCNVPPPQLGDQTALFDSGRDLPGAGEREQSIFWDVA